MFCSEYFRLLISLFHSLCTQTLWVANYFTECSVFYKQPVLEIQHGVSHIQLSAFLTSNIQFGGKKIPHSIPFCKDFTWQKKKKAYFLAESSEQNLSQESCFWFTLNCTLNIEQYSCPVFILFTLHVHTEHKQPPQPRAQIFLLSSLFLAYVCIYMQTPPPNLLAKTHAIGYV